MKTIDTIIKTIIGDIKYAEKQAYKQRAIELAKIRGRQRAEQQYNHKQK